MDHARRTRRYRIWKVALRCGNRVLRAALLRDVGPHAFALLETTGRRTGQARRTPVGNGLDSARDVFWLVAVHGRQADFVRNIEADPRVRVRVGRTWRTGRAVPLPDDDPVARSRSHPPPWDAALGRMIATTPLTVRIDLDPGPS